MKPKNKILGGCLPGEEQPTIASRMMNNPGAIAKKIAAKKVYSDTSRDNDALTEDGPNDAFVVRDSYGVLPAKASKKK